ncbi:MAG: GTP-binding protein [Candidatus Aenigmarchaeota archaeon]|nr:GTP-binding protein [Candidatus Aenigmarchaeota archaeon]
MKTPIVIITGYLGAGKTTLLRNIIGSTDRKLAVLMNEFGEIGVDGAILKGKNIDMVELSGGCVCCSMTGEFEAAIKEIREKVKPELIVVETTGVAEPDAIVGDILENIDGVRLDAIITIADADSLTRFPSIGHTGRVQIEMADVLVLNKTDLVSAQEKETAKQKLEELNDHAIVLEAVRCDVDFDSVLDIKPPEKIYEKHSHEHLKEDGIQSFIYTTEKKLSRARTETLVSSLPNDIIRVKGFVKTSEGDFLLNAVFGRHEFEEQPVEKTELVFIGKNALYYSADILRELKDCEIC